MVNPQARGIFVFFFFWFLEHMQVLGTSAMVTNKWANLQGKQGRQ